MALNFTNTRNAVLQLHQVDILRPFRMSSGRANIVTSSFWPNNGSDERLHAASSAPRTPSGHIQRFIWGLVGTQHRSGNCFKSDPQMQNPWMIMYPSMYMFNKWPFFLERSGYYFIFLIYVQDRAMRLQSCTLT